MQQKIVINQGKRYIVNVVSWEDGVGAGFATGQLVLKSITDNFWYVITTSGSAGNVTTYVSQSTLSFPTSSYFDLNFPYQLLLATNGSGYYVYLSGSAPNASLVVSQSAYTGSDTPKPYLLLQNITDNNYYITYLNVSASVVSLNVNQVMVSQSWVQPIF